MLCWRTHPLKRTADSIWGCDHPHVLTPSQPPNYRTADRDPTFHSGNFLPAFTSVLSFSTVSHSIYPILGAKFSGNIPIVYSLKIFSYGLYY